MMSIPAVAAKLLPRRGSRPPDSIEVGRMGRDAASRPARRRLAGALVLALVVTALPAAAAPVALKIATLVPDGSVWDRVLKQMAEDWREASGGEVTVRLYPGGVAGDDADIVRKMRIGQLHGGALTIGGLSLLDESFNVLAVPLFFESYAELYHVVRELEPLFRARLEEKGFVLLNWGHGGWAHFFSKRPITTVAELKQQKIFTWAGDQRMVEWWKSNGFQPVPLAMTDVLTGLQTGMIDTLPATPLAALSLQWFRQTPYMHDLGLAPVVGATVLVRRAWEQVPEARRPALAAAARRAEERLQEEIPEQDAIAVKEMTARGLTVMVSGDKEQWRREAERFAQSMRGGIVPPEIFDRALAARDAYRRQKTSG